MKSVTRNKSSLRPQGVCYSRINQRLTRRLDVPYVFHDHSQESRFRMKKKKLQDNTKEYLGKGFSHDLRHCFVSHLVTAGIDLTTVSRLLGRKSLTMTLRYAYLTPAHVVRAVDLLDSTLTGKPAIQKRCKREIASHV